MTHIIHITNAEKIGVKDRRLHIVNHDESEMSLAFDDVGIIVVENPHCYMSAMIQLELVKRKITLIICDEAYQPALHVIGLYNHFQLTEKITEQIGWCKQRKEKLWEQIVVQKIEHQKQLLLHLESDTKVIEQLENYQENIQTVHSNVLNQEAIAARVYFQALFKKGFKRFADDGYNAALNYGYMIIRAMISTKLVAKGLHPSLGLAHHSSVNNYNFVDDIIEIFRPMVDYVAYVHPPHDSLLEKEERQRLLLILTQQIKWEGKYYPLPQVIEYYIESLVKHLNTQEPLQFPQLEVDKYVY